MFPSDLTDEQRAAWLDFIREEAATRCQAAMLAALGFNLETAASGEPRRDPEA